MIIRRTSLRQAHWWAWKACDKVYRYNLISKQIYIFTIQKNTIVYWHSPIEALKWQSKKTKLIKLKDVVYNSIKGERMWWTVNNRNMPI